MNLWQDFLTNDGKIIHKWTHYFPIYEKHLSPWRNKTLTFLEIGVASGGSPQMWRRFFGPMATIIGIDINPKCAEHEKDGVHVRIGDQGDPTFLASLVNEFGQIDIVLDDGSHRMEHIKQSFEFLYPTISKNGIYIIEDVHTAYWEEFGGGLDKSDTIINISKHFVDELNADHSRGAVAPSFITRHTFGISFYDSVIVFERGTIPIKTAPQIGTRTFEQSVKEHIPASLLPLAKRVKTALT